MAKNQKENLSGFPWHIGYVTMDDFDERRDKRRCIYYVDESKEKDNGCVDAKINYCRIAGVRCKGSSHCGNYKEVGEKVKVPEKSKPRFLVSIPCSIPLCTEIITKDGKHGVFVKYEEKMMVICVNGNEAKFQYPQAFEKGYLKTTPEIDAYIKNDLLKAVWK